MLFGLAMNLSTTETRTQNWLPSVGCRSDDVYLGDRRNTQEEKPRKGWMASR